MRREREMRDRVEREIHLTEKIRLEEEERNIFDRKFRDMG